MKILPVAWEARLCMTSSVAGHQEKLPPQNGFTHSWQQGREWVVTKNTGLTGHSAGSMASVAGQDITNFEFASRSENGLPVLTTNQAKKPGQYDQGQARWLRHYGDGTQATDLSRK